MDQTLTVNEIFYSIQGEAAFSGWPCVFVRLTGCPLRCQWCDTTYAYEEGRQLSVDEVLAAVEGYHTPHKLVELTGGEPLIQPAALLLVDKLIERGFKVLIETSGAVSIADVPQQAHVIMDLKCPGSGMVKRNILKNLEHLKSTDEVKFVVAHEDDFKWACDIVKAHELDGRMALLVSPVWGSVEPKELVKWILQSKLKFRLNMQIHKFVWDPATRGV